MSANDSMAVIGIGGFTDGPVERVPDYARQLDFCTVVEGRPVAYELVPRAHFRGQDITERLRALGLRMVGGTYPAFVRRINALAERERAALLREELVIGAFDNGRTRIDEPLCKVSASVTRRPVFPAGRSLAVTQSCVPFAGGPVGGRLSPVRRATPDFPVIHARASMTGRSGRNTP